MLKQRQRALPVDLQVAGDVAVETPRGRQLAAGVFLVAALIALAGFLIVTLLRERPLRGRRETQTMVDEPERPVMQNERVAA